ncbi:MAG: hypothetical protein ACOCW2_01555 [Chitinivibrionales bacterium]
MAANGNHPLHGLRLTKTIANDKLPAFINRCFPQSEQHISESPKYRIKSAYWEGCNIRCQRVLFFTRIHHKTVVTVKVSHCLFKTRVTDGEDDTARDEGREEGESLKAHKTAEIMIQSGEDDRKIALYTGLSVEEIQRLRRKK